MERRGDGNSKGTDERERERGARKRGAGRVVGMMRGKGRRSCRDGKGGGF